jgi:hypothetical protein
MGVYFTSENVSSDTIKNFPALNFTGFWDRMMSRNNIVLNLAVLVYHPQRVEASCTYRLCGNRKCLNYIWDLFFPLVAPTRGSLLPLRSIGLSFLKFLIKDSR